MSAEAGAVVGRFRGTSRVLVVRPLSRLTPTAPLKRGAEKRANLAAQPTSLSPPVSGREANPRSAMHKSAASLVPSRQQPQRILQRIRQTLAPKAAFLWGSTPFLWQDQRNGVEWVTAATPVAANNNVREGEDALPYKFFCSGRKHSAHGASRTPPPTKHYPTSRKFSGTAAPK